MMGCDTLNIAHRGARSLAPENTLAAARKALEAGADMWELDVTLTRDGELIVVHDDTLERTSNVREVFPDRGPWAVSSFTLEEIRRLDFGSWFVEQDPFGQIAAGNVPAEDQRSYMGEPAPTLREALVFTRDHGWRVNVEMKKLPQGADASGYAEKVVGLIEELGMVDRVLVSSFEHDYLKRVKVLTPDIAVGALTSHRIEDPGAYLAGLGADAYHPIVFAVSADEIRALRQQGYGVNVWTVNDEGTMRALIEAGASGIFTDFPQVLASILQMSVRYRRRASMSKPYVAALDQGTTGTRFMVFSHDGRVVASSYQEHEQIYPQPGWVEHDPLEIWSKTQQVIRAALDAGGIDPADIAAVGVTNQRETTVIWERATGRPVYNAVVWQDTRTRDLCQQLIADGLESVVRVRAGLPIATYFSGPKIRWILDHVEGVRSQAERGEVLFGNIDTWLIWWLTGGPDGGVHVTDMSNASRTMLMDLATLDWDDELLAAMGIPRAMLPQIRPSSYLYGVTRADGPLGAPIPVCGDLGDQQAALVGQTCYSVGEAKNTYGTGCFMLMNTGATAVPSKSGLLTTVAYALGGGAPATRPWSSPGRAARAALPGLPPHSPFQTRSQVTYALEGSIAVTGAAVQWLRDNLGLIKSAAETEELARSVEDAGGTYFVPAFSGLFAPYWDMDARGVIVGLTRYVNRAHIVRATLEAICYQTRDVLEAMRADSGIELTALKVDGGAVKNNFLMQLQADILGVPVVRPTVDETTALGAAYAAGLAVGFWEGLADLRANWGVDRVFEPGWSQDRRESGYAGWKKAVERTRRWVEG